jgi:hypothetical protein
MTSALQIDFKAIISIDESHHYSAARLTKILSFSCFTTINVLIHQSSLLKYYNLTGKIFKNIQKSFLIASIHDPYTIWKQLIHFISLKNINY